MPGSVIVSGARTPIGKLNGALASVAPVELGGLAIAEALRRGGVPPEAVDYVVMGQVLQAGQGQNPARQAAVRAGVPMTVPATTVNKVCLSGLNALYLADLMISAGEADVVVAGGMESMSMAPHLLEGARAGIGYGDAALRDEIVVDGLTCSFEPLTMGAATERDAAAANVSRQEQDAVAVRSHDRAAAAIKSGRLGEEIVPVSVPRRRGDPLLVFEDEGVRPGTTHEQLARLRSAFAEGGAITAGNASQISDGAAALVIASPAAAANLGVSPLAEIVSYGQVAGPGTSLLTQPSRAIAAAVKRAGLALRDLEVVEVNEAFAAVVVASVRELAVPEEMVNPNGGAIALGHPIGMSGARLAVTLTYELHQRGDGRIGAAALCGGGGQGDAVRPQVLPLMSTAVTSERVGKVAVLRLDRPPVNSLSIGLLAELGRAVEGLAADLPGAVVITGSDRIFSAGADITEFGGTERAAEVSSGFGEVLDAIASLPRATVAAISGGAFGGGLELALACDFRFVAAGARLGQPEILLGIIPGGGGTQRLARLIGPARAKDIVLTGRYLSAEEAFGMGLADRLTEAGSVVSDALEFASRLAAGAVVAQALAKRAIDEGLGRSLVDGLALERGSFRQDVRNPRRRNRGAFVPGARPG